MVAIGPLSSSCQLVLTLRKPSIRARRVCRRSFAFLYAGAVLCDVIQTTRFESTRSPMNPTSLGSEWDKGVKGQKIAEALEKRN